eukprot:COSAG04_NODE_2482_length_4041_cov_4.531710_3_plen_147_part_00
MECEVVGVTRTSDCKHVQYHASDPAASYDLVSQTAVAQDYNPADNVFVPGGMVDYNLVNPAVIDTTPHGVPISFLTIKDVPTGIKWYKSHTKYPDEVCEMLARYEFGDLKFTTPKEFRNQKKRVEKKKKKEPVFQRKVGPVIVPFE